MKKLLFTGASGFLGNNLKPVSYTHLDVYKRQPLFHDKVIPFLKSPAEIINSYPPYVYYNPQIAAYSLINVLPVPGTIDTWIVSLVFVSVIVKVPALTGLPSWVKLM